MREILFRGKKLENGEWVYGDLLQPTKIGFLDTYEISDTNSIMGDREEIIPETIGQYTGLTDKNGKKIFEGDKLNCIDRILEVYFNEICGCWDCKFIEYVKGGVTCYLRIDSVGWDKFEVIGNIHDNPELLNNKKIK